MIIKICGMRQAENIRSVEQTGCTWMGFICYPKSPRYVNHTPQYMPHCPRIGVFVDADTDFITQKCQQLSLDGIQLHGHESPQTCHTIKQTTGLFTIKAISIATQADIEKAKDYENAADYLLFDTKCPTHGGSGQSFDWQILQHYKGTTPFLLSGGIGPQSTEELLTFTHPQLAGIDLNSRFETSAGIKDPESIQQFINHIKNKQK